MRFRLLVLLAFAVAAVAGIKPFYAQDDLFDDTSAPAADAISVDIIENAEPAGDAALELVFDDNDPAAGAASADMFDDLEPAATEDSDPLVDDPKPARDAKPEGFLGGTNPARTQRDDALLFEPSVKPQAQDLRSEVYRLNKMPAEQAAATVHEIFSDRLQEGLRLHADAQRNQIVIRGPEALLKKVRVLLRALDSQVAADVTDKVKEVQVEIRQRVPSTLDTTWTPDRSKTNEFQTQVRELASQYQATLDRNTEMYDASGEQTRKVADQLRAAVQQAFHARQQQQQKQIQQLQQRLTVLQKRVQEREQKSQQIIEQAIHDLLSPATRDRQTSRRRNRLLDALAGTGHATTPEAAFNKTQSQSRNHSRKQAVQIGEEYQIVDAEPARQMMRRGYTTGVPLRQFQSTQISQARDEEQKQKQAAYREQRRAEQIAADAAFETNIQRLELNLAEANAELAFSEEEHEALKAIHDKSGNSATASQLRKIALQHSQAVIKVQRAKLELEAAQRQKK